MGKAPDKIRARVAAKKKAQKKAQKKAASPRAPRVQTGTQPGPKNSSKDEKTALKAPARPKAKPSPKPKGKASTPAKRVRTDADRKYDRERRAKRKKDLNDLAAKAAKDAKVNTALAKKEAAKTGNKKGMPAYAPSEADRRQVQTMVGLGLPLDQVRVLVLNKRTGKPPSEDAFRAAFARELVTGPAIVNSQIAASLLKSAKGHIVKLEGGNGKKNKDGTDKQRIQYVAPSVQAQIWLSKVRLGWNDEHIVTVDIKSGVLVAPQAGSVQDWLEKVQLRNAAATEPGASEE